MSNFLIASEENIRKNTLAHHGIKGQKWGRRRWQNEDGSLTKEGRERYGTVENFERTQRRKRIATGAVIGGTAAALAIGGGILAYKNRDKIKESMKFKKTISGLDSDKLTAASGILTRKANEKINSGKSFKELKELKRKNDAITRELAKRARREARFANAGKEALKKIFKETSDSGESAGSMFGKSLVGKVAKGGGAAIGAGLVGAGAAYLAGKTEGNKLTGKAKRDRYRTYMWQNPNKK